MTLSLDCHTKRNVTISMTKYKFIKEYTHFLILGVHAISKPIQAQSKGPVSGVELALQY